MARMCSPVAAALAVAMALAMVTSSGACIYMYGSAKDSLVSGVVRRRHVVVGWYNFVRRQHGRPPGARRSVLQRVLRASGPGGAALLSCMPTSRLSTTPR